MEAQTIYGVIGIVIFSIIVFITLRKKDPNIDLDSDEVRSTKDTKADIINGYQKRLKDELEILDGDNEAIKSKKIALLNEFNAELSKNIFFDKDEIKIILLDLSEY